MKLAIIILWSEPWGGAGKTGGLITAGANLAEELGADLFYCPPSERRKRRPAHHQAYEFRTVQRVLDEKYDFVIFTSAGHFKDHSNETSAVQHIIDRLDSFPPFAVQVHDEVEVRQLARRSHFFDSPQFRFALPITEEIGKRTLTPSVKRMVYPAYKKRIEKAPNASARTIGMTGRMAARKNTIPFLERAAPALISRGWEVRIHGAEVNFFYARDAKRVAQDVGAKYCGPYDDADVILRQLQWHVNIPYLKRGNFIPRIEIATVEAAAAGCGIITLYESTPSFYRTVCPEWSKLESIAEQIEGLDADAANSMFIADFNERHVGLVNLLQSNIEKAIA
jgi:hypothetical protein